MQQKLIWNPSVGGPSLFSGENTERMGPAGLPRQVRKCLEPGPGEVSVWATCVSVWLKIFKMKKRRKREKEKKRKRTE